MPSKAELQAKIDELKKQKKEALEESQVANDSQTAYKLTLNSVYGFIGTKYSPVFNKTIAEAVTKSGQHCTKEMVGFTNNLLNDLIGTDHSNEWVVAGDTDSLYVRIDNVLKKLFGTTDIDWYDEKTFEKVKNFVDTEIQTKLNQHIADFICETCYTDQRRIEFKREKISSEGDFLAKKHYALHARDNEGLPCDKFEYKGVDIAKNELTTTVKDMLRYIVENMMKFNWNQAKICSELQALYEKFCTLDVSEIGYIKNLNKTKDALSEKSLSIEDDDSGEDGLELDKGAGVHARSARIYNSILKNLKISDKYEEIRQGDRLRYVYVKAGNKYDVDCIGWKDRYPDEFRSIFEVDYDLMWEKIIMSPLKKFLINHKCNSSNIICQYSDKTLENEVGESLF